jgi:hypothetical protein
VKRQNPHGCDPPATAGSHASVAAPSGGPGMTGEPSARGWDERRVAEAEAEAWVAAALPGHRLAARPTVLNRTPWGITARFDVSPRTAGCPERVVFKATLDPELRHAGRLAMLLSRRCPGLVPDLIAHGQVGDRVFALYRWFDGTPVETVGTPDAVVAMTRALARIQAAVAATPSAELAGLPRLPVRDVPALLDPLLAATRDRYIGWWREEPSSVAGLDVPPDLVDRLAAYRPRLDRWAAELDGGPVPLSVDHVDFLGHNAVVKPDGGVLVHDWEQAVLSCPMFSVDVLLLHAQQLDRGGDWGIEPERHTPDTDLVRRAYLAAAPWGTPSEREHAWELAMALAPLRYAWSEGRAWARLGEERSLARSQAWWLTRALGRWARLAGAP